MVVPSAPSTSSPTKKSANCSTERASIVGEGISQWPVEARIVTPDRVGHLGEDVHVATEIEGGRIDDRRDACLAGLDQRLRGAVHECGAAAEQRGPSADDPRRRTHDVLVGEDEPQGGSAATGPVTD